MKIIHYINDVASAGAEKLLTDLLPILSEYGHEVIIICSNNKKSSSKHLKILKKHGIKIYDLNLSFYNPFQVFKLIKIFKKENPHIMHAHLFPTQYWLALTKLFYKNKEIKFIKTEHSVLNERKSYKVLRGLEKFIYNQYDKIIGITDEVSENLKNWLSYPADSNKIITINNGVNLDEIRNSKALPSTIEFSKDNFNILMVARFDGYAKDQKTLIDALEFLPKNTIIYFAGDGASFEEMKNYVKAKELEQQVKFLGVRSDVYILMHNIDLNVLSTNFEGLSGVTLESLASSKPFIGSDVVGVNSLVPSKEFLFEPKNAKSLSERIIKIMNNVELQNKMVAKGNMHIKKYDINKMANSYNQLYLSVSNDNK